MLSRRRVAHRFAENLDDMTVHDFGCALVNRILFAAVAASTRPAGRHPVAFNDFNLVWVVLVHDKSNAGAHLLVSGRGALYAVWKNVERNAGTTLLGTRLFVYGVDLTRHLTTVISALELIAPFIQGRRNDQRCLMRKRFQKNIAPGLHLPCCLVGHFSLSVKGVENVADFLFIVILHVAHSRPLSKLDGS